jgi:hypothetical protein
MKAATWPFCAVLGFDIPPRLRALLSFESAVELSARTPGGEHLDPAG